MKRYQNELYNVLSAKNTKYDLPNLVNVLQRKGSNFSKWYWILLLIIVCSADYSHRSHQIRLEGACNVKLVIKTKIQAFIGVSFFHPHFIERWMNMFQANKTNDILAKNIKWIWDLSFFQKFVFHGLLRRHRYGIGGGRSNHRLGGGWRRSQPDSNPRQQQQQHNYRHPQHHWRYHHYHHHYHHHLQRHHPADRNGGWTAPAHGDTLDDGPRPGTRPRPSLPPSPPPSSASSSTQRIHHS